MDEMKAKAYAKAERETIPQYLKFAMSDLAWWEARLERLRRLRPEPGSSAEVALKLKLTAISEIVQVIQTDARQLNRKLK